MISHLWQRPRSVGPERAEVGFEFFAIDTSAPFQMWGRKTTLEIMNKRLAVIHDKIKLLTCLLIDGTRASHHRSLYVDVLFLVQTMFQVRLIRFIPALDVQVFRRNGLV